jgi:uncharacterized protein
MAIHRWLIALSVALVVAFTGTQAPAATINDKAHLFDPTIVEKARVRLDRLERTTHIPVVIETIDEIPGLDHGASPEDARKAINKLALRRDQQIHDEGIYILISKREHLIANPLIRERLAPVLPLGKRDAIRSAFITEFKKKDFDGGLERAVETIERALAGVSVGARAPIHRRADGPNVGGGRSMMGTFVLILLGIFGVLLLLRLLGGLFGRSPGAYRSPMGMPRPGMGPGPGGYGAPGYGGGGGFFSGLLGGLGGALAGNWLYDQFSGRHGHISSAEAYSPDDPTYGAPDQGGDAIVGADDHGGQGASWDDGGGDAGGDWGGGGDGGGDW